MHSWTKLLATGISLKPPFCLSTADEHNIKMTPRMTPIEARKQTVELFSNILCGFPHFPVTEINCAGNCFATLNQNSDVFRATKLAKACNFIGVHLYTTLKGNFAQPVAVL